MASQVVQRLEQGVVQTITITIGSTGVAQNIGTSIAATTVMKKCQAVNFSTASVGGVYIGWRNTVTTSTGYRRKQTTGMENWELAASEEAIKSMWIVGTAGETLTLELVN